MSIAKTPSRPTSIYIPKYKDIFQEFIQVNEYEIGLPDPPDLNKIENYNRPESHQKFRRSRVNIKGREIYVNQVDRNAWDSMGERQAINFADREWNLRNNGKYVFIGGKLVYIPGTQYTFCNYWDIKGNIAGWRDGQNLLFLLWEDTLMDPTSVGLNVMKGRRIGWTQIINFLGWEWASKVGYTKSMYINKDEKECKRLNMTPIFLANAKMAHHFKPIHSGKEIPTGMEMSFKPDSERMTTKKLKDIAAGKDKYLNDLMALNSEIIGGATTEKQFDGQEGLVIIDEYGKMTRVDINNLVSVHKKCAFSGVEKVGGLMAGSTIEEVTEEQMVNVNDFWNACEPGTGANYVSESWLRRYMWPFWLGLDGFIDEYGFSKKELAIEWANSEVANLSKRSKKSPRAKAELRQFKRKHPQNEHDALEASRTPCIFFEEGLKHAKNVIVTLDEQDKPHRGYLRWKIPYHSVEWVPAPDATAWEGKGKFMMYKRPPDHLINNVRTIMKKVVPNNISTFCGGIDPYDTDDSDLKSFRGASRGSLRIKRRFDALLDGDKFEEDLVTPLNGAEDFVTCGTQMMYICRPESTHILYEDFMKALIFYGCPALFESNKMRLKQFAIQHGCEGMLMDSNGGVLNKKNVDACGMPVSEKTKSWYFDLIDEYTYKYYGLMKFDEEVEVLLKLNKKNVTHLDYGAAFGMCEIADRLLENRHQHTITNKSKLWTGRMKRHKRR